MGPGSILRLPAVVALLGAIAISTTAVGCTFEQSPCSRTADAARWRSAPFVHEKRYEAAKQLADCGDLIGATKREVRGMLGPPHEKHARRWWYDTGFVDLASGPGQSTSLGVFFDGRGHVRATRVPHYVSLP
jgi:hypothetical protein